MPILTLTNTLSTAKFNRAPDVAIDDTFDSGTDSWNAISADVTHDSTNGYLAVAATSTGGYAYKSFTTVNGVVYFWSVNLMATGIGGGHVMIGTSRGDTTHGNIATDTAVYYSGTFTASGTTTFIHLQSDTDGITNKWDNVLVETKDN